MKLFGNRSSVGISIVFVPDVIRCFDFAFVAQLKIMDVF
jgi:hypothetical protein